MAWRRADDTLVLLLAAGRSVKEAADGADVGERTAYRRLADPSFRCRVSEARGEMVTRAIGKLADASTAAVDTLQALLAADAENVRLGAAKAILELGAKLREAVELGERLAALEGRVTARENP